MKKKIIIRPSGITYTEAEETIERVANTKAKQHGNIAFFDPEDIRQEVRIKCWNVLKHYDPARTRANLYTFLSVCAENRLRDIKRSVMYKHTTPCDKCEFYNKTKKACVKFYTKTNCEKCVKHERYVQAKLSSSHPVDINTQKIYDENSLEFEQHLEIIDYIEVHLPSGYMPLFQKFQSVKFNFKHLRPRERIALQEVLSGILKQYGDYSNE